MADNNVNSGVRCVTSSKIPPCDTANLSSTPIYLNADMTSSVIIPSSDPVIKWPNVREDKNDIYDPITGIVTIPENGLWSVSAQVTIDQDFPGSGFPNEFYQHLLLLGNSRDWPFGSPLLFLSAVQNRFNAPQPAHQIFMRGSGEYRLEVGDQLFFQLNTVTFGGGTTIRDTEISGVNCLNCMTFTRLGN